MRNVSNEMEKKRKRNVSILKYETSNCMAKSSMKDWKTNKYWQICCVCFIGKSHFRFNSLRLFCAIVGLSPPKGRQKLKRVWWSDESSAIVKHSVDRVGWHSFLVKLDVCVRLSCLRKREVSAWRSLEFQFSRNELARFDLCFSVAVVAVDDDDSSWPRNSEISVWH